jgi:hypothetical protein
MPTVNGLPFPVSGAGVGSESQELLPESPVTVQLTGREQVPISLSKMVFTAGDVPWAVVKLMLEATGTAVQGGNTFKVTETVCGLPMATVPALSVAEIVKLALIAGPLSNPAILTVATKTTD